MKFFRNILLYLSILLLIGQPFNLIYSQSNPFENLKPDDMAELDKLTEQLLQGMSPEERAEVFREAEKIASLSEEEQKNYLENAFKELDTLLGKESVKQELELPAEITPEPEIEPVKAPKEKILPSIKLDKIEKAKEVLENIIDRIDSILIKSKTLPRVSQKVEIEKKWSEDKRSLKNLLIELKSYLEISVDKDKLLKGLFSDEFSGLRNNLEQINKNLTSYESKLKGMDTAGLTISFGEEEGLTKKEIEFAQIQFEDMIKNLLPSIENNQILSDLRKLLQKYAPEDLKKLEQSKVITPAQPQPRFEGGHVVGKGADMAGGFPGGGYGYPNYGGYPSYRGPSYRPEMGSKDMREMDDKKSGKPSGGSGGKGTGKDQGTKGKEKEDKKSSIPTKSPEKKKEAAKNLPQQIKELSSTINKISDNVEQTPVSELMKIHRGPEKPKSIFANSISNLSIKDLEELEKHYDKALKLSKDIFTELENMSAKDSDKLNNQIKEIIENPKFKAVDEFMSVSDNILKNQPIKKEVNDLLTKIIDKHNKLKILLGIKTKEEKGDKFEVIRSMQKEKEEIEEPQIKRSPDEDLITASAGILAVPKK